jgi:hypothetical protein
MLIVCEGRNTDQAFEYWLILHFESHQGGAMDRRNYNRKINSYLKRYSVTYQGEGNKKINHDFFELLVGIDEVTKRKRVELAIERAEKIYSAVDASNPARAESSTTVYTLVSELLRLESAEGLFP